MQEQLNAAIYHSHPQQNEFNNNDSSSSDSSYSSNDFVIKSSKTSNKERRNRTEEENEESYKRKKNNLSNKDLKFPLNPEHNRRSRKSKHEISEDFENDLKVIDYNARSESDSEVIYECSYIREDKYPFRDRISGDCSLKLPEIFASKIQLLISRVEQAEMALVDLKLPQYNQSFMLTDARISTNPIVYVSRSYMELTGYFPSDVLGKSCLFAAGTDNDITQLNELSKGFTEQKHLQQVLKNKKSDGTEFWNFFRSFPLFDKDGNALMFLIIQSEVACPDTEENSLSPLMSTIAPVAAVAVEIIADITAISSTSYPHNNNDTTCITSNELSTASS